MMTLRQTYEVCKRGYRYDIEHDRFISDMEDYDLWFKQYGRQKLLEKYILAGAEAILNVLRKRR